MNLGKLNDKKSTQWSVFYYSSNKQTKKEIKKTIPFTVSLKGMKYLWINLTKELKDMYIHWQKCWR